MKQEHRPAFVYETDGAPARYYSLRMQESNECELNNLAVLPAYRHDGIGKKLLDHACETARRAGYTVMNIGIVEENTVLLEWYEKNGAVHTGTRRFDRFPFTCGLMKIGL